MTDRFNADVPTGPAAYIECCICLHYIRIEDYHTARCWTDPHGISCAAHAHCLIRVGEHDLGLRTDQ